MANNRLDLIIFGATGFTGKYTVKEAVRLSKESPIKFGIAGRRKEALEAVLKEFAPDIEDVPVIIADLKDEESLQKMTEQAKVIVNCCGPFRFYGEPVIKACIATGTHHVDVSGEPQYMEKIQLEYNKAAKDAGIYIVSACGICSIASEMGVIFTQQKFDGEVNSIETYTLTSRGEHGGPLAHYGTWESAVYGVAHVRELYALREKLYPEKLPIFWPRLKSRGVVHRAVTPGGWSVPFPECDQSVVYRSQRFFFEKYNQRPIQVRTYYTIKSFLDTMAILFLGAFFFLMTQTKCGRKLLLKYPSFFSGGSVNHDGPTPEAMEKTEYAVMFKAEGWTEKLAEPTDKHTDPPNKELITKVSCLNPAYGATCTALLLSAIMILKESDKIPENGGVLPPGAAFAKTSMIEELNKNGYKFEVISSIEK